MPANFPIEATAGVTLRRVCGSVATRFSFLCIRGIGVAGWAHMLMCKHCSWVRGPGDSLGWNLQWQ